MHILNCNLVQFGEKAMEENALFTAIVKEI